MRKTGRRGSGSRRTELRSVEARGMRVRRVAKREWVEESVAELFGCEPDLSRTSGGGGRDRGGGGKGCSVWVVCCGGCSCTNKRIKDEPNMNQNVSNCKILRFGANDSTPEYKRNIKYLDV